MFIQQTKAKGFTHLQVSAYLYLFTAPVLTPDVPLLPVAADDAPYFIEGRSVVLDCLAAAFGELYR